MNEIKAFWNSQKSSLNRSADPQFYRRKAEEHVSLLTPFERSVGAVDLGCGAGELLVHLAELMRMDVGLDFSGPMLAEAEKLLTGTPISLVNADVFDYLPGSRHGTWMTTGGLNQYLDVSDLRRFLDIFSKNQDAKSLFLFDCVDHLRFSVLRHGISYLDRMAPDRNSPRSTFRRLLLAAQLAAGQLTTPTKQLSSASMGYGYLPSFWRTEAEKRSLEIEIVSSRFYEYRYHAILRKPS